MTPEFLASVDVGQVHFHHGNGDARHRIPQRQRIVGESAGIEDHSGKARLLGRVQPFDELALEVRLPAFDPDPPGARVVANEAVHLNQSRPPVHRGLPRPEEIQVGPVENQGGSQWVAPTRPAVNSTIPRRRPSLPYAVYGTSVTSEVQTTCANMPREHSMGIASSPRLLSDILVEEGSTTADVAAQALARTEKTGESIGEALVAMGAVSSDDVLRALARQLNLTYLSRDELPSPLPVLKNLSPKYLRQYAVCPVSVDGNQLTVATADPLNPLIADDLRQSTGLEVKLVVSTSRGHHRGDRSNL